jgi:hypothetical protein
LRNQVRDSGSAKIINGYPTATKGAELAYKELEKIIEIVSFDALLFL